jgi:hypothetical protein
MQSTVNGRFIQSAIEEHPLTEPHHDFLAVKGPDVPAWAKLVDVKSDGIGA